MSEQEVSEPGDSPDAEPEASAAGADDAAEAPDEATGTAVATADAASGDVQLYEQGFEPADPVKDRLLLPLLLPLLSMAAILVFVLNLSRVFLAAGNGAESWIIAGIVTVVILVGAAAISASPRLRTSTLTLTVATFLVVIGGAGLIALGPSEPHGEGGGGGYQEPAGDPNAELDVVAQPGAAIVFDKDAYTSPGGILQINYILGTGTHTLVFEEPEFAGFELAVGGGVDRDEGKVEIAEGDYVIFCTIPGHRAAGMEATVTITPGEAPPPADGEAPGSTAPGESAPGESTTTAP